MLRDEHHDRQHEHEQKQNGQDVADPAQSLTEYGHHQQPPRPVLGTVPPLAAQRAGGNSHVPVIPSKFSANRRADASVARTPVRSVASPSRPLPFAISSVSATSWAI